jgi:hypothetical protein
MLRLRVGRKVGRTIYIQTGEEPSTSDQLVGVMDTPELARLVVDAVNARAAETPATRAPHGNR